MPDAAYIYWPNGGRVQDTPTATLHPDGYAVVALSRDVHVHVETPDQGADIAQAFTRAGVLLTNREEQA